MAKHYYTVTYSWANESLRCGPFSSFDAAYDAMLKDAMNELRMDTTETKYRAEALVVHLETATITLTNEAGVTTWKVVEEEDTNDINLWALLFCENTDSCDPTNSTNIRFFSSKEKACEEMLKSYEQCNAILHFDALPEDDEHSIERTEMGIAVIDGNDTYKWLVVEAKPESQSPTLT